MSSDDPRGIVLQNAERIPTLFVVGRENTVTQRMACNMPKFFFDFDGEPNDEIGVELADRRDARSQAIVTAGEMLRDIDGKLSEKEWKMRVRNILGETVLELRFSVKEISPCR